MTAIDLSRKTFQQIKMNYAWACVYNFIGKRKEKKPNEKKKRRNKGKGKP